MAMRWVGLLASIPALLAMAMAVDLEAGGGASSTTTTTAITTTILVVGLMVFGGIFAINSAVHSYLIVAWSSHERVAMNVGFYYMANAGGRLTGTVLSGLIYQLQGLQGCLWGSAIMLLAATLLSVKLAPPSQASSV
jgi:predicted MFS family arabinose efflux permease